MRERIESHPNLTAWVVLAVGMLVILAWSARDVSLSASQWFWLAAATVLLAGLCAWIISWEADDDGDATAPGAASEESVAATDDAAGTDDAAAEDAKAAEDAADSDEAAADAAAGTDDAATDDASGADDTAAEDAGS